MYIYMRNIIKNLLKFDDADKGRKFHIIDEELI